MLLRYACLRSKQAFQGDVEILTPKTIKTHLGFRGLEPNLKTKHRTRSESRLTEEGRLLRSLASQKP